MRPDLIGLKNVYLHPGEACFSSKPIVVSTVLGSCLSVTMFSKKIKYAGISHCQLPYCKTCDNEGNDCADPFKYVSCTIKRMFKKFDELHINKYDIEVKLFGGADVLKTASPEKRISTIGRQNIEMAVNTLAKYNITPIVTDVGGDLGRKIIFFTETGEVFLNRLKNNGQNKSTNS